jgi:hypothetical protein
MLTACFSLAPSLQRGDRVHDANPETVLNGFHHEGNHLSPGKSHGANESAKRTITQPFVALAFIR